MARSLLGIIFVSVIIIYMAACCIKFARDAFAICGCHPRPV